MYERMERVKALITLYVVDDDIAKTNINFNVKVGSSIVNRFALFKPESEMIQKVRKAFHEDKIVTLVLSRGYGRFCKDELVTIEE